MTLEQLSVNLVFQLMLIFTRLGGMFSFLPAIGELYFPVRIRLVLALTTCVVLYPVIFSVLPSFVPTKTSDLLSIVFIEFLVGVLIGLSAKIYFLALDVVGHFIAMNAGLSAANFFNPNQRAQQPVTSILLSLIATMAIFASNAHHFYFIGFVESYSKFPIGEIIATSDISEYIAKIINESFIVAFKIASPFIIVNIAIQVGTGVLARLMPALQIFFIILPVQIIAMFSVLLVTISFISDKIVNQITDSLQSFVL
jgi:flagellar biosynthetic protein FliR